MGSWYVLYGSFTLSSVCLYPIYPLQYRLSEQNLTLKISCPGTTDPALFFPMMANIAFSGVNPVFSEKKHGYIRVLLLCPMFFLRPKFFE